MSCTSRSTTAGCSASCRWKAKSSPSGAPSCTVPATASGPTPAKTSTSSCPASGDAAAVWSSSTAASRWLRQTAKGAGTCGPNAPFAMINAYRGAVAHLGERFNGIEEVEGSIPPAPPNSRDVKGPPCLEGPTVCHASVYVLLSSSREQLSRLVRQATCPQQE